MHASKSSAVVWVLLSIAVIAACGDDDGAAAPADGGATDGNPDVDGGDADGGMTDGAMPWDGGTNTGAWADGVRPFIYLNDVNAMRLRDAVAASAPAATRFLELVDAQIGGTDVYAYEPWFSALAYQVTDQASYCEHAVSTTDAAVAEEEALIDAGMRANVAADSYLHVGPIIGSLAIVYDWCHDFVDEAQRARWIAYANQAVFNVWSPMDATWGGVRHTWSGWSIDNPANNYYYSFLRATMLLGIALRGEDPMADTWLRIFRDDKIAAQLVPTFERDLAGGGSREGTGYGTALRNLFELYDLWEGSSGERIADLTSHTRASLPHFLHTVVPTQDFLVPVGDHARDSTAAFFDYHRAYLLELAHLYRDTPEAAIARGFLRNGPLPRMANRFMFVYDFLYDGTGLPEQPLTDLHTAYYGSGTGQMYFRSSWDRDATLLHAIGGPFTESHAHEDQGSILLYRNQWLAYDSNVPSRSGIVQDTTMHNLVRLTRGGMTLPQRREMEPAQVIAVRDGASLSWVAVDVAPVYASADVTRVRRDVVFLKPRVVVVLDRVDASVAVRSVWQLNTPIMPSIAGAVATMNGPASDLAVHRLQPPTSEVTAAIVDYSSDPEITSGHRLELRAVSGGNIAFLTVLGVDGAVASATALGPLAARVTINDGRVATVDFEAGAVTIDGVVTPLVEGVDALPVLAP